MGSLFISSASSEGRVTVKLQKQFTTSRIELQAPASQGHTSCGLEPNGCIAFVHILKRKNKALGGCSEE